MNDNSLSSVNNEYKNRLHTRFVILRYLLDHPGAIREDLRVVLQTTHQNVTYHLSILEEAGFIFREDDQTPHRWYISHHGIALFGYSALQDRLYAVIPLIIGTLFFLAFLLSLILIEDLEITGFLTIGYGSSAITAFSIGILILLLQHRKSNQNPRLF